DQFFIERYSHVMHIVSNVEGKLSPRHDAVDALAAGFPAGTVSGAPKVRAMEIIDELEKEKRGLYAGSVGYVSAAGEMDTCIVLRTALVKDGIMYVQAGAGGRLVAAFLEVGRWLLSPVVALFFRQWPLREIVQHFSREANDLGQWLFALYVARAFTAATRAHTHLAADAVARHYGERTRVLLARLGALLGLLPWALFIIIGGAGLVIASLLSLDALSDTYNP